MIWLCEDWFYGRRLTDRKQVQWLILLLSQVIFKLKIKYRLR